MTHPSHNIESTIDARWLAEWERGCDALILEADALLRPRRQRKPAANVPGGLKTAAQAAAKLGCSIKTLKGHVAAGALKYVILGHGTKRPRRYFTDADLAEFIQAQTRKDEPCPSDVTHARRSGNTISRSTIVAFSARPRKPTSAKPKP